MEWDGVPVVRNIVLSYCQPAAERLQSLLLGVRDVRQQLYHKVNRNNSHLLQEFLFYHQKDLSDIGDEIVNPVTPWAQMMRSVLPTFFAPLNEDLIP